MKRSFFITSSIGVASIAALPAVRRLIERSDVVAATRRATRATESMPGRCYATRSATRWTGFTLADVIA